MNVEQPQFDTAEITARDLIRAQYHTWPEPQNGLVTEVNKDMVLVLFQPGIHVATCYFPIFAREVADGKWGILFTHDLREVKEVPMTYGNDAEFDT